MPLLHITRTQRPVGQGFFHTATIASATSTFRYVYDCGAMPKYREARSNAIKAYRDRHEKTISLDILFLSHAHADHVNGVAQLLKGLAIDTIMLPLLSIEDRLIAFARSAFEAPASARDPFYRAFIADPATALARFAPRQILFVKPGSPGEGAPGADGGDIGPYDEGDDQFGRDPGDDVGSARWKLIGRGPAEDRATMKGGGRRKTRITMDVATIPDSRAIAVDVAGSLDWLLAPYIDPSVVAGRHHFFNALRGHDKFDKRSLADPKRLIEVLSDKNEIKTLVAAYKTIDHDLNVTSLCLFSGPTQIPPVQRTVWRRASYVQNDSSEWFHDCSQIAWLATGDAALKKKRRVSDLDAHYGAHLAKVCTLTLPHHGSDYSADEELLEKVKPALCVASADLFSTWRHPGTRIMQLVASRGVQVALVTGGESSEFVEDVRIF